MRGRAAIAAALAVAGLSGLVAVEPQATDGVAEHRLRAIEQARGMPTPALAFGRALRRVAYSGGATDSPWRVPPPTGWTNASYARASRKRRNQARNRRAHRG